MNKTMLIGAAAAMLTTGCVIAINPSYADQHSQQSLSLSTQSLNQLMIDAGAGSLSVYGQTGLDEITVEADIYHEKGAEHKVELSLKKKGKAAELISRIDTMGNWQGQSPRIDLVVNVPAKLLLDIEDGSGAIVVRDIDNAVSIDDGSGSIELVNVSGEVRINDGSGKIELANVGNSVDIKDGSGSIDINEVNGDLAIDDSSGSIEVAQVSGNADIEDGSGSLTVHDVGGVVTIDDGSGSIEVKRAGGLNIISDGSGGVTIKDVKGQVAVND